MPLPIMNSRLKKEKKWDKRNEINIKHQNSEEKWMINILMYVNIIIFGDNPIHLRILMYFPKKL